MSRTGSPTFVPSEEILCVIAGGPTVWRNSFQRKKTRMLGYKAKDFVHYTDFTKLVHEDDHEKIMNNMRDHMAGTTDIYEAEYRILAHDGSWKTFHNRGRIVVRNPDKSITAVGIVYDITKEANAIAELKELNLLFVDRELKIVELKAELARLKGK